MTLEQMMEAACLEYMREFKRPFDSTFNLFWTSKIIDVAEAAKSEERERILKGTEVLRKVRDYSLPMHDDMISYDEEQQRLGFNSALDQVRDVINNPKEQ